MPFARLTVADEHLPAATRAALAEGITALLASDLRKARETTVLEVSLVPAQSWFVAGRQHPGTTGAHLEVGITVGSNSAEERSRFIANAYAFLAERLGAVPPAVYVALFEVGGESYGVNGHTQFARRRAREGPSATS